jgi:hypothetical protein
MQSLIKNVISNVTVPCFECYFHIKFRPRYNVLRYIVCFVCNRIEVIQYHDKYRPVYRILSLTRGYVSVLN